MTEHFWGSCTTRWLPTILTRSGTYEYGGIYGVTLSVETLDTIERSRTDREELSKLVFYSKVKSKEKIAAIGEKLLMRWRK